MVNSRSDEAPPGAPAEQDAACRRWITFADDRLTPDAFRGELQNLIFAGLLLEALFRGLAGAVQRGPVAPPLASARAATSRRGIDRARPDHLRIGIVGAGPSGLGCAHALREMGYRHVHIFERNGHAGGKSATWFHEGRPYDLGAHVITTEHSEHHPHLMALLDDYGVELEPVTPYFVFDGETRRRVETPPSTAGLDRLTEHPDFAAVRAANGRARALAYGEGVAGWLAARGLSANPWNIAYTASGYGFIDDDTPAGHFVKLVEMSTQHAELACTPREGFQSIWDRIGDSFGPDLHLNTAVQRVERRPDGTVAIHPVGDAPRPFDAVILCTPPSVARRLLGDAAHRAEQALFARVRTVRYFTLVCEITDLPRRGFYLIRDACADRDQTGRVVAFHHRHPESDIYTLYAYGRPDHTPGDIMGRVADDIRTMGGTLITTHVGPVEWAYMPHFGPDDLALGALDRLEGLQGLGGVYHASALGNFELVDCCVEYARDLVHRYFGRPLQTPLWAQRADALPPIATRRHATRSDIEAMIRERIAGALGQPEAEVDLRAPLETLGLESITLFQLVGEVARMIGRPLAPQVVAEYPDLASLLDAEVGRVPSVAPISPAAPPAIAAPGPERVTLSQRAFADQHRRMPGVYQNLFAFDVPPTLRPDALAAALTGVMRRQPGLRLRVRGDAIDIAPEPDPAAVADVLEPTPLRDLAAQLRSAGQARLDLTSGAVRWGLLRSAVRAVLLMRVSHMAYDAGTLPTLTHDLDGALHAALEGRPPTGVTTWPAARWSAAEHAYLRSPERRADAEFWRARGPGLPPDVALDPAQPLRRVPRVAVGDAAAVVAGARAAGCSTNSALLWAFGHAAAEALGVDSLPLGFAVDLRALYDVDSAVSCAVMWVPVAFDRWVDPATLHGRVLRAAARARLPNDELRLACGLPQMHPMVMFFSYVDGPAAARGPRLRHLQRIDTAHLPVERPNVIQGFARRQGDGIIFDARARIGAAGLAAGVREALARLGPTEREAVTR